MIPSLTGTAFYLLLLPVLALVGSIALGVLFRALIEPWRSRTAAPAPSRRSVQPGQVQGQAQPAQEKDALVIHPRHRSRTSATPDPEPDSQPALRPA